MVWKFYFEHLIKFKKMETKNILSAKKKTIKIRLFILLDMIGKNRWKSWVWIVIN